MLRSKLCVARRAYSNEVVALFELTIAIRWMADYIKNEIIKPVIAVKRA